MTRYSEQFEVLLPNVDTHDFSQINSIEGAVKQTLGPESVRRVHQSTRTVEAPEQDINEVEDVREVPVIVVEVYLDEYYHKISSPKDYVGENAQPIQEALSGLDVTVSTVVNSAAPVPE